MKFELCAQNIHTILGSTINAFGRAYVLIKERETCSL